ncbi:MAG: hypothetical protein IKW26_04000 [Treponema sp.]|nr:hypothetical protein [Treponema sp.]
MKIKALGLLLLVLVVSSCSTMKKIDFEKLETSEFILSSVSFDAFDLVGYSLSYSDVDMIMNRLPLDDIKIIMSQLPIDEIAHEAEVKYGVKIDTSFFHDKELFLSSIKPDYSSSIKTDYTVSSYEQISVPHFKAELDTGDCQRISILFSRSATKEQMGVDVSLLIYDNTGSLVKKTSFNKKIDESFLSIPIVNRQNSAELVLSKRIFKTLNIGIYKSSEYSKVNGDGEHTIYLEGGKEYFLSGLIEDPGVFMIYDPVTFYATWIGTLESGKRYELDYKINRPFLKKHWNLEWVLTELE